MEVKKIVEVKREGKYHPCYTTEDMTEVYKDLANALINKRVCHCSYINMIVRVPLYNGFTKIKVYYTDNVRHTYIIEER